MNNDRYWTQENFRLSRIVGTYLNGLNELGFQRKALQDMLSGRNIQFDMDIRFGVASALKNIVFIIC